MTLTREQARVLLHKHLTGEFPGQKWATIEALFRKELIEAQGTRLVLTARGKSYCDDHHMEMP